MFCRIYYWLSECSVGYYIGGRSVLSDILYYWWSECSVGYIILGCRSVLSDILLVVGVFCRIYYIGGRSVLSVILYSLLVVGVFCRIYYTRYWLSECSVGYIIDLFK